jgi:hypothetical protein
LIARRWASRAGSSASSPSGTKVPASVTITGRVPPGETFATLVVGDASGFVLSPEEHEAASSSAAASTPIRTQRMTFPPVKCLFTSCSAGAFRNS